MKTEEIRECLGRCLTLTATQDNIYRGIVERSVTEARAELAALETAIAVKDETLAAVYRDTVGNAVADVLEETLVPGNKWFGTQGWMVFVKRHIAALRTIPAALTGSPSGAFVTLEQLREIEWSFTRVHEEGADVTSGMCPVCEHESHTSDCWLAAKLKEVGDGCLHETGI